MRSTILLGMYAIVHADVVLNCLPRLVVLMLGHSVSSSCCSLANTAVNCFAFEGSHRLAGICAIPVLL